MLQRRQAATTFVQMSVPLLAERTDMVARQLARGKAHAAVHADVGVPAEQRLVVERRHIVVARVAGIARMPDGRDDGIHLEHRAPPGAGIHAAVELVEQRAAGVCHLFLVIEPGRLAVIDPLERHSRDIRAQHELREPARRWGRDDAQILVKAAVGTVQIDALTWPAVRYGRFVQEFNAARS